MMKAQWGNGSLQMRSLVAIILANGERKHPDVEDSSQPLKNV